MTLAKPNYIWSVLRTAGVDYDLDISTVIISAYTVEEVKALCADRYDWHHWDNFTIANLGADDVAKDPQILVVVYYPR